jgi:hypothetical protein
VAVDPEQSQPEIVQEPGQLEKPAFKEQRAFASVVCVSRCGDGCSILSLSSDPDAIPLQNMAITAKQITKYADQSILKLMKQYSLLLSLQLKPNDFYLTIIYFKIAPS